MPYDQDSAPSADAVATASAPRRGRPARLALPAAAVVIVALAAAGFLIAGRGEVSTDDAYVQADTAQVTALVPGAIVAAPAQETQVVKAGDLLARIDPADYLLARDRARTDLEQARRRVRQYVVDRGIADAQHAAREAELARAEAELQAAQLGAERRRGLETTGAISGEELVIAETQYRAARAAVALARANARVAAGQQQLSHITLMDDDVERHPEVVAARSRLAAAEADLARTDIRAPIDGVVTRKSAQVGQKVASGAPLLRIVPVQRAYVEANFKEGQLRGVKLGQPVELTSDLYGAGVRFHGRVAGFAGGTGAALAVIPAQNATGNWIKVVQRLPVRIALDPGELAAHPLRIGLSMAVKIRTGG